MDLTVNLGTYRKYRGEVNSVCSNMVTLIR